MPVLLPFQAFQPSLPALYVPGEEDPRPTGGCIPFRNSQPALFVYRQQFRAPGESVASFRQGVMGLLNRAEARIFPHEEVCPQRVSGCARLLSARAADPGSLWLWCGDANGLLAAQLEIAPPPEWEARDRFDCLHQIWPIIDPLRIHALQSALQGQALFIADGHHRYAAGWNLATIQIRSDALQSRPSHRLVLKTGSGALPATEPVPDIEQYLASAPAGYCRAILVTPGPKFGGIELLENTPVQRLLGDSATEPVREIAEAIASVESGRAQMALLMGAPSVNRIENNALQGTLLPPKSTDFFPKLAAGLVVHKH